MTDPLQCVWPLLDCRHPLIADHVAAAWPPGMLQQLVELKFLREAEAASTVLCPECGEHEEEVVIRAGPGGEELYFIPCPSVMRARVPVDALRQWAASASEIADALASTMGLKGRCTELVADRLWRLGRTDWQGKSRDVLFARGLHWDDGASVRAEIVRGRKPIVFLPVCLPPDGFWRRSVPPMLVLAEIADLVDDQLEIDALAVASTIRDAEAGASSHGTATLTEAQLKLMIRSQLKAERKSELQDDLLVAAYRLCGSYRAAAEYLSEQSGDSVSKDAIFRAVQRSGGALAVLNPDDSDSVVRGVASQSRDKRGKNLIHSQAEQEQ